MRKVYYIYNPKTRTYDRIYPTVRQRALSYLRQLFVGMDWGQAVLSCCCGFSVLLRKKTFVRKTPDFCHNMPFFPLVWMRRKE